MVVQEMVELKGIVAVAKWCIGGESRVVNFNGQGAQGQEEMWSLPMLS